MAQVTSIACYSLSTHSIVFNQNEVEVMLNKTNTKGETAIFNNGFSCTNTCYAIAMLRGRVGKTADTTLNLRGRVGKTADATLNLQGRVGKTADATLNLQGRVGKTADATLNLQGCVGKTADTYFDTAGRVGRTAVSSNSKTNN